MKRKSIILLSSILAGSLLVGGAFAAWAVTDSADPFGVNVTPGSLDTDKSDYTTLSWGASTKLDGVENIKAGENRKVGVVNLMSDNVDKAYTGIFSIKAKDVTVGKVSGANLFDYFTVYVYDGVKSLGNNNTLPEGDPLGTIAKNAAVDDDGYRNLSLNVQTSHLGHELTIFVSVDSAAFTVFDQMAEDKIYLEVDWGAKQGEEAQTMGYVYYTKPAGWTNVYAFAWVDETLNAEWPGVQMVQHNGDVYKITVPQGMKNIIFNDGQMGEGHQTTDLNFTGYNASTAPYWSGTAWTAIPAAKDYYLVGKIKGATEWATPGTYKFAPSTTAQGEYVLEVTGLKKDDQLKVAYFDGTSAVKDDQYAWAGDNLVLTKDGDYTLYFSPVEKDDWATGAKYGDQYGFAKHLWVVPPAAEQEDIPEADKLELTVNLHGYASDNAVCFIHYWGEDIEGDVKIINGKATINKNFAGLIVVRMPAGSTAIDYATAWNKSDDILPDGTKTILNESTETFGSFSWAAA